jgi:hypothetical protein
MSETPPPPDRIAPPPENPQPDPYGNLPPSSTEPPRPPLKGWQAFGIGVLLFVISTALAMIIPFFPFLGFIAAVVCLFFAGYRHIFTGYIAILGLALLVLTVVCFVDPPDFK